MRRATKKSKKKYIIAAAVLLGIILAGVGAYKSYLHITFSKRAAIELNLNDKSINGLSANSNGLFTSADYSPEEGNAIALNLHMADGVTIEDPATLDKNYSGKYGDDIKRETLKIIKGDMVRSLYDSAVIELKILDHDGATAYEYHLDVKR